MADLNSLSDLRAQAGSNLTGRANNGHNTELLDRYGLAASSRDAGAEHRIMKVSCMHGSFSIPSDWNA